jgi:hypothetical protein
MGARRLRVGLWISFGFCGLMSCSPAKETSAPQRSTSSGESDSKLQPPLSPMLTLPSWCSMRQATDQVCFKCERTDGGIIIPYEQCLTPADSFQASTDCDFNDGVTKTLTCAGTASGKTFVMDISIAKEKVSAVVPALLLAIELAVKQRFADQDTAKNLATDLSAFISARIKAIAHGVEPETTAGDLLLFVNRYVKTPLTAEQAGLFKKTTAAALKLLSDDLTGRKDYRITQTVLRLLSIARTLPDREFEDIKPYLTGPAIAELLADDRSQSLIHSFSTLNPSLLGVKSAEDLIAELKSGF